MGQADKCRPVPQNRVAVPVLCGQEESEGVTMGAYMIQMYNVVCDNFECQSKMLNLSAFGCRDAVDQVAAKGWIKVGRRIYCCKACAEKAEAAR